MANMTLVVKLKYFLKYHHQYIFIKTKTHNRYLSFYDDHCAGEKEFIGIVCQSSQTVKLIQEISVGFVRK